MACRTDCLQGVRAKSVRDCYLCFRNQNRPAIAFAESPVKYVDYYAALGVPRDADLATIKKAYRLLARQHHPDVSKEAGSEEKFKNAALAYATLKDADKRAAYDHLKAQPDGTAFDPVQSGFGGFDFGQDVQGFDGMDLSDLLDAMRRGQSGHGQRSAPGPRRGRDQEDAVQLTLEEAAKGCAMRVAIATPSGTREMEVRIPAGVHANQRIRLRGQGDPGTDGGTPGDLYLHVRLAPHTRWRVDGQDLFFDLVLTPWEAALGTTVNVPTLTSEVLLTVPAGTSSGKRMRLRGHGMPHGNGTHTVYGHMVAVIQIAVPATASDAERGLWEQLANVSTFSPRKHL